MQDEVIVDGNNLLHAMQVLAPLPSVGRTTMVQVLDRWAKQADRHLIVVFDGPEPPGRLADQMRSPRVDVHFSSPRSADDLIVDLVNGRRSPTATTVVSSDTAVAHAAKARRCIHLHCRDFVAQLFTTDPAEPAVPREGDEKPEHLSPSEVDAWIEDFGLTQPPDDPLEDLLR